MPASKTPKQPKLPLTKRELTVLKLIFREKTNKEIAHQLGITDSGVEFHRKNIYKKTKSKSIVGLVKYALKSGLVKI